MTAKTRLFHDSLPTPVGPLSIVSDDREHLRAIYWDVDVSGLEQRLHADLVDTRDAGGFTSALADYFSGRLDAIDHLAVFASGTPFQKQVWTALRTIPLGTTISYRQLAERIGRPAAVRAVGTANGSNPISIVVPCHRVIGADNSLTGYGGGLERKAWLLQHEGCLLL